jgi:hypothetical protein
LAPAAHSDITAGAYEVRQASPAERASSTTRKRFPRRRPLRRLSPTTGISPRCAPPLLAQMPVGVRSGLGRVFEATDSPPRPDAELGTHVAAALARRRVDVGDPEAVVGLRARRDPARAAAPAATLSATSTAPTARRADLRAAAVGGDQPTGRLTLAAIGALREHLPPSDAPRGYADRLDDANLRQSPRGYLRSIDPPCARENVSPSSTKTNGSRREEELTAWHRPWPPSRPSARHYAAGANLRRCTATALAPARLRPSAPRRPLPLPRDGSPTRGDRRHPVRRRFAEAA